MKFVKFESRHNFRNRTPYIWVNLDTVDCVSEYPKWYVLRISGSSQQSFSSHYRIEKTSHNRKILSENGVVLNE